MKIVCDRNMPFAVEAFSLLGEVVLREGRMIGPEDVREAEMLVTRSTTRVNAALLDRSAVRFYGSGVIGTDHIDIPYLNARQIVWTGAPGCNAESVANYVTAALLWLGGRFGFTLAGKTLGVIGVGHVGRRVCAHAKAMGMRVLANDPPRQRDPSDSEARAFVPLDHVLAESDILTCHVPLTREGTDATWHLLNPSTFARLKPGAILINAARGAVIDTGALLAVLGKRVAQVVIDCWEGEPAYCPELLARTALATPHIAGHSFEGKVNGTAIVYRRACDFFGIVPAYAFALPEPPVPVWRGDAAGRPDEAVLRDLVLSVYDIEADSDRLRASCVPDAPTRAAAFDRQRGGYPMRREFASTRAALRNASAALCAAVRGLGFAVEKG
ncbi:MAG TPA: 4-phosphoerythronate dehydrogenase [Kiritimatiellia bacterium]|jgi:erythronate-4-phosphate dehydrogenase|nr:4-phosphoerythronate dehydrogenase [Kiritimatiellia bacterium]HOR98551.1 4-phosphoerythronate dehydrogenase [Kiritimatiellia bacterium]